MINDNRTKKIVKYAVISAIILVGFLIDTVVSATLPVSTAIASIVVVSAMCQLFSFREAVFAGAVFGAYSMFRAVVKPGMIQAIASASFWTSFANPLISILPRIIMAIVIYETYRLFVKLFDSSNKTFVKTNFPSGISSGIGAITNTILCLTMMGLMKYVFVNQLEFGIIASLFSINFAIELPIAIIVTPILVAGVKRAFRTGGILQ